MSAATPNPMANGQPIGHRDRLTLRSTGRAGMRFQLGEHRRGPPVSLIR